MAHTVIECINEKRDNKNNVKQKMNVTTNQIRYVKVFVFIIYTSKVGAQIFWHKNKSE